MTLKQFVLETINKIHDFDAKNRKSIKKLIRLAIEDLQFRTVAKVEGSRGV
ncbi:hypothetical protein H1D32_02545 [Anaerobacillus sp. CMMVII]|uniref:DUF6407 family protein n=1 Tax=Anaerobacillus sp. CMMVII TaxID=2755588 RepID=UPI0021B7D8A9|nr:DUF6407 family protein [Anaerobacillus sp. CMMVII]MCT8136727.1 hypothetical protein [Anaerobacillus sp. CMMVII]